MMHERGKRSSKEEDLEDERCHIPGFEECCKLLAGAQDEDIYAMSGGKRNQQIVNQIMDRDPYDLKEQYLTTTEHRLSSTVIEHLDFDGSAFTTEVICNSPHSYQDQILPNAQDFAMLLVIGAGSYGKVMLASMKDVSNPIQTLFDARDEPLSNLFAIKSIRKSDVIECALWDQSISEKEILHKTRNDPFIVNLFYAFQDEKKLYYVLEYCPGKDLLYGLNAGLYSEQEVQFYSSELCIAIQHLHEKGIAYRDMKPENVVVDREGHVKLVDFGLSKTGVTHAVGELLSVCGTEHYMAPEIILESGHGFAVDWWGLGVLMFELLTGAPPWYDAEASAEQTFNFILHSPLEIPSHVSKELSNLLHCLIERDPNKRIGTFGIQPIKKHAFFSGLNWNDVMSRKLLPPFIPGETIMEMDWDFDEKYSTISIHSHEGSTENDSKQRIRHQKHHSRSIPHKYIADLFQDFDYVNPHIY